MCRPFTKPSIDKYVIISTFNLNTDAKYRNDAHFTDLVPSLLDSSLNQSLSASLTYCKNLGTFSKQK